MVYKLGLKKQSDLKNYQSFHKIQGCFSKCLLNGLEVAKVKSLKPLLIKIKVEKMRVLNFDCSFKDPVYTRRAIIKYQQ